MLPGELVVGGDGVGAAVWKYRVVETPLSPLEFRLVMFQRYERPAWSRPLGIVNEVPVSGDDSADILAFEVDDDASA